MATKITFDKSVTRFILEAIGCRIDKQGYITKRGRRVKSISKENIKLSEFGGVVRAKNKKWIFVKDDIFDLIKLVQSISKENIKLSEFGGVVRAKNKKWIFVKDDIFDLIKLVQMQEDKEVTKKMVSLKDIQKTHSFPPRPKSGVSTRLSNDN